ncbi:MAG: hypothetical protein IT453_09220 [Planctomycetes bacterium]|nr:hypothetical protein [Planctomycetota bacterium]
MLSVVLALSLAFGEPVSGAAPEVWLCVERGRAEVVGEGPTGVVDSLGAWRRVEGSGELRLDARASASLRWNGRGSLELDGPSRCEFAFDANGAPSVRLSELSGAHLEVRKGELALELDGGWRARGGAGVLAFDSRGSSGVHVERLVGGPVCFERAGPDPAHARRVFVEVGASALLPLDPVADPREAERELRLERAALWPSFAWPWSPEEDVVPSADPASLAGPGAPGGSGGSGASAPGEPEVAPASAPNLVAARPSSLETRAPAALDATLARPESAASPSVAQTDDASPGGLELVPAAPLADSLAAVGAVSPASSDPASVNASGAAAPTSPGEPAPESAVRELARAHAECLLLALLLGGFGPAPTSELAAVPIRRDGELLDTRFGARWRP